MNELQAIELSMFGEIADICQKHGIRYFALGGTLLGAVRHKGFIPWDDDIDIVVPRPDYDILVELLQKELPDNLYAETYRDQTGSSHPIFICQVKNRWTNVRLEFAENAEEVPVWVDVFPLDGMPGNGLVRNARKLRLLYLRMKTKFSMYESDVHQFRSSRPFHERALMRFREITGMGKNWDTIALYDTLEATLKKCNYESADYVVNMMGAYKFREMFPKEWLGDGVKLPFETTTICCPIAYDKVLTQMYGDYMAPPPPADRNNQHKMTVIRL